MGVGWGGGERDDEISQLSSGDSDFPKEGEAERVKSLAKIC